jgi:hypothetical protein
MASNGKGVDVRGEVANLLVEKIASDRNPSVTMMNLVEELLAPDDVPHIWGLVGQGVDREAELIHDPPVNSPLLHSLPVVAALSRSRATCPETLS